MSPFTQATKHCLSNIEHFARQEGTLEGEEEEEDEEEDLRPSPCWPHD